MYFETFSLGEDTRRHSTRWLSLNTTFHTTDYCMTQQLLIQHIIRQIILQPSIRQTLREWLTHITWVDLSDYSANLVGGTRNLFGGKQLIIMSFLSLFFSCTYGICWKEISMYGVPGCGYRNITSERKHVTDIWNNKFCFLYVLWNLLSWRRHTTTQY